MDYDALRDMVEGLLQEFGSITSLRVTTGRVVNGATGVVTSAGTPTDYDVSLVVLPMDAANSRALDALGGVNRAGSRRLVLVSREVVPKEGDELWVEGAWRLLPALSPVAPHMGAAVCYTGSVTL